VLGSIMSRTSGFTSPVLRPVPTGSSGSGSSRIATCPRSSELFRTSPLPSTIWTKLWTVGRFYLIRRTKTI